MLGSRLSVADRSARNVAPAAARLRWVKVSIGLLITAALCWQVYVLIPDWTEVTSAVTSVGALTLVWCVLLLLAGGACAMAAWAAVLHPATAVNRDWAAVFFIGQLGKYLPGSVWAAGMQAALGRSLGMRGRPLMVAFVITFGVSVGCACLIGVPTLSAWLPTWCVMVVGALTVLGLAHIATVSLWARWASRAATLPVSPAGLRRSIAWSLAGWCVAGLPVAVLAIALGAPTLEAIAIGISATALAMAAGSLVIVSPGGLGVRELVLITGLSTIISPGDAAAVALLSRVLTVSADALLAGWAWLATRPRHDLQKEELQ